jgi:hypothetical protein
LEARKGYPNAYFYALGHLGEAEDELVVDFEELAAMIRLERKKLEADPGCALDFDSLVSRVSVDTGYDVAQVVSKSG